MNQSGNDSGSSGKPEWMKEESVKNIPQEKLDFLQKLVIKKKNLSRKELMPFLMALAQRSKNASVLFTEDEVSAIIEALKKHSSSEEIVKMNQILKLMHKKN